MEKIPVYLFTGFLESGKTKMIQESLEDKKFNSGEKTLLLVCEEGIEEYDPEAFWGKNVNLRTIDAENDLTAERLRTLADEHKIDRVIVEYNGMWQIDRLYAAMPDDWAVYQEMMFADATTINSYNTNMRSLVVDKISGCEMVVFNRCPHDVDKEALHKLVRGISRKAQILYEYTDGEMEYDTIEDPLPFDLEADVIEIKDDDYAIWYRDMAEDMKKYVGKTLKFRGIVARDPSLSANEAVVGRHVMTCCADDIAYNGLICRFKSPVKFNTRDWVIVTAKLSLEKHKLYRGQGPMLTVVDWAISSAPAQEVATFY